MSWFFPQITEGHHLLSTDPFLPNLKRPGTQNLIIDRLHEVAAKTKQVLGEAVPRQKPLSLSR